MRGGLVARRVGLACLAAALSAGGACTETRSPRAGRPEEACVDACERRAGRCSRAACARGCELSLDRLVEHEGDGVVACVAKSTVACDDWLWSECAARVGVHADGGPPAPASGPRH